jgi:cation diffusion facilitator family transporter
VLRTLPQRRSRAAIRNDSLGESSRTIIVALFANVVIAVAKLIAGLISGSTAMLAEAAHSVADSLNEVLLGVSLKRARRPADANHPLGHGRERFLWAFMAAIASFLIGGCVSIGLAVREFESGGPTSNTTVAWIVLLISFTADGTSWLQSVRQARRDAKARGRAVWNHLLRSSEPIVRAVVLEDSAALIGLVLAAGGLLFSQITGSKVPDAIASLLIGILLAVTAFGLARPLADFLIGRSLPREQLEDLRSILAASPAIEEILHLQAVYTGPEEVIVAAKVHPSSRLTIDQLASAMDDLDQQLRAASPFVADVFVDITRYRGEKRPANSND